MRHAEKKVRFLILLILLFPVSAFPQYFGRNKVQYENFKFNIIDTENFSIYFYPPEENTSRAAARMLERWYFRFSNLFNYKLEEKNPIIFYSDSADFRQTNIIPGLIGESVGGVTEMFKRRVVIPLEGSYSDINHVLGHELVHVFHYALARREDGNLAGANLPLWFIEGMPEYLTLGRTSPQTVIRIRDAIIEENLPGVSALSFGGEYFPYRWGHALWAYIGGKWGDEIIPELYVASLVIGLPAAIQEKLGVSLKELSEEWHEALKRQFEPALEGRQLPEDIAEIVEAGSETNLAPSLSGNGRYMAFLSRKDFFTIELFIYDLKKNMITRKISSSARYAHFDALKFVESSGAWSPDNRYFAFVVFSEGDNQITIFNTVTGEVEREISTPKISSMSNPAWSPDGKRIVFTGSSGGVNNLYIYNLQDRTFGQLTEDRYTDMHASWSPDGKNIVFASDRGKGTDFDSLTFSESSIGIMDVETGEIRIIEIFEDAKNINPVYSPDGKSIYFISNAGSFPDIYRYSFEEKKTYRITRIATGITGLSQNSPALSVASESGDIAFSAFREGGFQIYSLKAESIKESEVEGNEVIQSAVLPPVKETLVESYLSLPLEGLPGPITDTARDYVPRLSLDYLGAALGGVVAERFGFGVGGGLVARFSDMLGEHIVGTELSLQGNIQNAGAQVFYLNRTRRLNWGGAVSRIPYLSSSISFEEVPVSVNGEEVQAIRINQEINRVVENEIRLRTYYPLFIFRRLEFGAGYNHTSYERTLTEYTIYRNRLISEEERDISEPEDIDIFPLTAGYVGDSAFFGFTSPVKGTRFKFEIEPVFGTLSFFDILTDCRKYFFSPYATFAVRLFHFGHYGKDSEDERLSTLFVGQPYFVRGYELDTFSPGRGNNEESQRLDTLIGNKIGVLNLELRFPVLGTEEYGYINVQYVPVELALFLDGGAAWVKGDLPELKFSEEPDERVPVFSYGGASRINLFGAAVFQIYYAYPFQHPGEKGHWGLLIGSGW